MAMPVGAFFRHNAWANQRLIDVCVACSNEHLGTRAAAAYGSILETLVHLVASEQRYIRRLGGDLPTSPIVEGDQPSLEELKQATVANGEVLTALAASASSDAVVSGQEAGLAFESEAAVFLVQTVTHSAEHRTQVITMLSTLGVGPEGLDEQLDAWAWGEATGALRTRPA